MRYINPRLTSFLPYWADIVYSVTTTVHAAVIISLEL